MIRHARVAKLGGFAALLLLLGGIVSACGDSATATTGFTPLASVPTTAPAANGGTAGTPAASGTPAANDGQGGGFGFGGANGGQFIATAYIDALATQLGIPVTPGAGFGGGPGGFGAGLAQMTDDQLAQAVQNGQITQAQADCVKTARTTAAAGDPGAFATCFQRNGTPGTRRARTPGAGGFNGTPGAGRNGTPGAGGFGRNMAAMFAGSADAIAKALNMSTDDLKTQLQQGKTLADIATAQKVDIQAVKDAITNGIKTTSDQAVSAGTMQQAQADNLQTLIKNNLDKIVTTKVSQ